MARKGKISMRIKISDYLNHINYNYTKKKKAAAEGKRMKNPIQNQQKKKKKEMVNCSFLLGMDSKKLLKRKKSISISSSRSSSSRSHEPFLLRRCSKRMKQPPTTIFPLKEGDRIDITQLLFTKQRDFLIRSNTDQLVKAEELQGKVIVLFFASLDNALWIRDSSPLIEIYNQIHHNSPLEVVFVALTHPPPSPRHDKPPHHLFNSIFSSMPWTAIPYSDFTSRERLETAFGFSQVNNIYPDSSIIDPTGLVLALWAESNDSVFSRFGALGYPFTEQRLQFIESQDNALLKQPSITKLLTSPERDYLLSNDGVKVPVLSLENKVVALLFFEEGQPIYCGADYRTSGDLTLKLIAAYEHLVQKHDNFEVVLVYAHDSIYNYGRDSEDAFWEKFKTMPWLALPYKDPVYRKLKRLCNYPLDLEGPAPDPRLVIVGPRGEFFEPFAADILMNFGTQAYPFTRRSMVELVAGKAKKLKPDMLWDPDTVLRRRDGSEVQFSQVAGKRIILLIGIDWALERSLPFLKSKYNLMKDTDDEFEVIHILDSKELEYAADVPWLVHPPFDEGSLQFKLLLDAFGDAQLVAFDRHGQVVRKADRPDFRKADLPDFEGVEDTLEKEVYSDLRSTFRWPRWGDDCAF